MQNMIENVGNKGMTSQEFMYKWQQRTEEEQIRGNKEYNIRYVQDYEGTLIIATDYDIRVGHNGEFVNLYFHRYFVGQILLKNVEAIL